MGMSGADQAGAGDDWRMQLRDMRTQSALRAPDPAPDALRRLSDRALRAAAHNPDHSEAARAAAEAELRARNLSADRWRLTVPTFIRATDLDKGDKLFFGWGRALRVWSGASVFAALLLIFAAAFWMTVQTEASERCLREGTCQGEIIEFTLTGEAAEAWAEVEPGWHVDDAIYGAIGLTVLVPLVIWLLASILRRKPARVLLLRKFNRRDLAEPLERMIAHELRAYGHVASLSDKFIRRDYFGWVQMALLSLTNPLAAIWFVIGLPVRFVWRLFDRSAMGPATVTSARDYRNLARRLRDRIGLNAQVAMVSKEAFLVRTSDAWWKMVVRLLMDSCDAIVVDLSQVTAGTAWELDVIAEENAAKRCVFVALWGKLEEAEAALAARGIAAAVHHYAPDGEMQRRRPFRAAMLDAMRATHA